MSVHTMEVNFLLRAIRAMKVVYLSRGRWMSFFLSSRVSPGFVSIQQQDRDKPAHSVQHNFSGLGRLEGINSD